MLLKMTKKLNKTQQRLKIKKKQRGKSKEAN